MSKTERLRPHYDTQAGDTFFVKRVGWRYEVWFSREERERGEWRALHGMRFWKELSAQRVAQSLQIASNQAWWWRNRLEDVETEASATTEASIGSMRHAVEPSEADGVVMVACGKCAGIGCEFCDNFGHFNRPVRPSPAEVESDESYTKAFYQIAEVMGIGARTASPKEVFAYEMLPKLKAALDAMVELKRFRSERSYVVGFNDGFSRAREGSAT